MSKAQELLDRRLACIETALDASFNRQEKLIEDVNAEQTLRQQLDDEYDEAAGSATGITGCLPYAST